MTEHMQRCFDDWRAAQQEGAITLRQELAYKDGFADAVKMMQACWTSVCAGDVDQGASQAAEASQRTECA